MSAFAVALAVLGAAATADGQTGESDVRWRIEERPHGRTYAVPLLLISGPGASEDLFFFDDEALGPWFSGKGWRVYAVSLTGPGGQAETDIGELIAFVRGDAGTSPVVMAHGLAGTAVYEWLAEHPESAAKIRALVTIGAPWQSIHPSDLVTALAARGADRATTVRVETAAREPAFFTPPPPPLPAPEPTNATILELLLAGHGISRERATTAFRAAALPLSPQWTRRLSAMATSRTAPSSKPIPVGGPVLLVAGNADVVAPPESVKSVRPQLEATSVTYRKIGPLDLADTHYAHLALVAGERAPRDVFAAIQKWLDEEVAHR